MANIQRKKNRPVHITVIPRDVNRPVDFIETNNYEIQYDVITMPTSKFVTYADISKWQHGDFVLVKFVGTNAYFYQGIVDAVTTPDLITEPREMTSLPLEGILKTEFPATYISGTSFESHMKILIDKFLKNSPAAQLANLTTVAVTNTPHKYQPSQAGITATNLMDYYVNGFKKYRVVLDATKVNPNTRAITVNIKVPTKNIKIKDNVRDFSEWEFTTTVGTIVPNRVYVYAPLASGSTSETVNQASFFYLQKDGQVVVGSGADLSKVQLPVTSKVVNRDASVTPPASQDLQLATDALSEGKYAHELKFDLDLESSILNFSDLEIGMTADITYHGSLYKSVFTGYNLKSSSNAIRLTFGHNRNKLSTRLREKLE